MGRIYADYKSNEDKMPRGYIIMLLDKKIGRTPYQDAGTVAMSI